MKFLVFLISILSIGCSAAEFTGNSTNVAFQATMIRKDSRCIFTAVHPGSQLNFITHECEGDLNADRYVLITSSDSSRLIRIFPIKTNSFDGKNTDFIEINSIEFPISPKEVLDIEIPDIIDELGDRKCVIAATLKANPQGFVDAFNRSASPNDKKSEKNAIENHIRQKQSACYVEKNSIIEIWGQSKNSNH
ncbi:hypothetical protein R50072_03350 [Simiduia litorea]|uniref:hypothetical protein n=1 Tax=Simiduia litorea TaxID=1435348 RepID=UPI0036F20571